MAIDPLNLDPSLSSPDNIAAANVNGAVRFIDEADSKSLAAMRRLQNDLVVRDNLIQKKVNELIGALKELGGGTTKIGPVSDPTLALDPTNKQYVDAQCRSVGRSVALLSNRVSSLNTTSLFISKWKDIAWGSDKKEKIDVILKNVTADSDFDNAPDVTVDFDNATSITLLLRADVSSVGVASSPGTPSYVYRSVTFGQSSGIKFDDVYCTSPNKVSMLVPYSSFFAAYPALAGYRASQPNSISVKAFVTTTQVAATEGAIPELNLTEEEIAILTKSVRDSLSAIAGISFNVARSTAAFCRMTSQRSDGSMAASDGVLVNSQTIRLVSPPVSSVARLACFNAAGDIVKPSFNESTSRTNASGIALVDEAGNVYRTSSFPHPVFEVPVVVNGVNPLAYRSKVTGQVEVSQMRVDPSTLAEVPAWAARVKLRIVTACHTMTRNGATFTPCAVRAIKSGSAQPESSVDQIAQSVIDWDYGNSVIPTGAAGVPYQASDTKDVWVDLVSGQISLDIHYYAYAVPPVTTALPWGLCVIYLTAWGK